MIDDESPLPSLIGIGLLNRVKILSNNNIMVIFKLGID